MWALWWSLGCALAPAPTAPRVLEVRALSWPASWVAAEVAGADAHVVVVAPVGVDPPTWQPEAALVSELQRADLLVAVGVGYEAFTGTAMLPEDRWVDLRPSVPVSLPEVVHQHGGGPAHRHGGVDPHVWMDPANVALGVARVRDALAARDPAHAEAYRARADTVLARVSALDAQVEGMRPAFEGRVVGANHPAFDYLARRLGVTVVQLHLDPTALDTADLARVQTWLAQTKGVPDLWWEAAPSPDVTAALPAGIRHLVLSPVEQPEDGAYAWDRQFAEDLSKLSATAGSRP